MRADGAGSAPVGSRRELLVGKGGSWLNLVRSGTLCSCGAQYGEAVAGGQRHSHRGDPNLDEMIERDFLNGANPCTLTYCPLPHTRYLSAVRIFGALLRGHRLMRQANQHRPPGGGGTVHAQWRHGSTLSGREDLVRRGIFPCRAKGKLARSASALSYAVTIVRAIPGSCLRTALSRRGRHHGEGVGLARATRP